MTLRSSNIYWEESTHTEGKSDRKQEDLMTLQHEKVVKGSLRSQNMKKKKLLAAMSSFEVSLKSMESTLYSLPDTCEAGKKTTIALNQSLRWRYFPWVGMRPALSRREMQDYFKLKVSRSPFSPFQAKVRSKACPLLKTRSSFGSPF